ncbi:MAG: hypothetical protein DRQ88_09755 [Epsilonproteobacteria bacterium]|nr:MAG: hypothetical protein DRQ89_12105 [Campylobacterota bacterium]RLA65169.1 MAG: hypothetical protein DRQ88_09755 [Campylobacterota bacterium]
MFVGLNLFEALVSMFLNTENQILKNVFPNRETAVDHFQFGLEAEFMLVSLPEYKPLWYQDLDFKELNAILEDIPFEDIKGRFDLLKLESPSKKIMPFVVEGYHLPDGDDLYPKGIEIRTPACSSIKECLDAYKELHLRLQNALAKHNLKAVALSHHPIETKFSGPCNKRRYDYWQWAMEVMTTYGPDFNISVPQSLLDDFNQEDFEELVNYYSPALCALSVGSPFYKNDLWKVNGEQGSSYRIHKRSVIAPPIEFHGDQENRFEFKIFEMGPYLQDMSAYFLLSLLLILNKDLSGRCDKATRIYEMGEVARRGLKAKNVKEKLKEVLKNSEPLLKAYGLDPTPLTFLKSRIEKEQTLADELINLYLEKESLRDPLEYLSTLR